MSQFEKQAPDGYHSEMPPQYTTVAGAEPTAPPPPPRGYGPEVIAFPVLGHHPQRLTCPNCMATETSLIQKEPSPTAVKAMYVIYVLIMLLALLVVPLLLVPLACIPLCKNSCMQTEHVCQGCNHIIGVCRE